MLEKINVKIVAIIIGIIIVIGIAIIALSSLSNNVDKSYVLEKVSEEDYKYFTIVTNGKCGVIDEKGNVVVQSEYSNIIIPNPSKPVFIVYNGSNQTQVLNDKSEKIFQEFNNIQEIEIDGTVTNLPYEKSLLKYEEDGKYGLIDFSGNMITKAIYDDISSVKYKEGEILAKKNGKCGIINNKGVELIPFEYDEIEADKYYKDNGYTNSGYIVKKTTREGYRYGYFDSEWKKILDTEYTNVERILDINSNDVYLIAAKNGQSGILRNGNVEIDFAYQSIEYEKNTNVFKVERNGLFGIMSISGKEIINVEYKDIKYNGIYILAKSYNEDILYFNNKGEKLETSYIAMFDISQANSYITVNSSNLYGIMNTNGEETVKNEYLYIEYAFDKNFIAYKDGVGFGVIDNEGKVLVDFNYDVLSKVGEHKLLKAVDMEKNITDIYSQNMEKVTSIENATLDIHDEYIEIYNDKTMKFITKSGELKEAKEILKDNKLFALYKDRKMGLQKCE